MPAKVITEILDKYATAPKSNMQALEDHELSIVFEHLTQNNQISNIAAIYADEPKKPEAPQAEAPKTEVPKAQPAAAQQTAKPAQQPQQRPAQQGQQKPAQAQPQQKPVQQVQRPAQQQAVPQQKSNKSTATAQPTTRVPEKKLVDTRKGGDVNLAKYDQRLEELGGRAGRAHGPEGRQGEVPHQQPAPGRHDLLQQAPSGRGREDAQAAAGNRQEGPRQGPDPR